MYLEYRVPYQNRQKITEALDRLELDLGFHRSKFPRSYAERELALDRVEELELEYGHYQVATTLSEWRM